MQIRYSYWAHCTVYLPPLPPPHPSPSPPPKHRPRPTPRSRALSSVNFGLVPTTPKPSHPPTPHAPSPPPAHLGVQPADEGVERLRGREQAPRHTARRVAADGHDLGPRPLPRQPPLVQLRLRLLLRRSRRRRRVSNGRACGGASCACGGGLALLRLLLAPLVRLLLPLRCQPARLEGLLAAHVLARGQACEGVVCVCVCLCLLVRNKETQPETKCVRVCV